MLEMKDWNELQPAKQKSEITLKYESYIQQAVDNPGKALLLSLESESFPTVINRLQRLRKKMGVANFKTRRGDGVVWFGIDLERKKGTGKKSKS